jgi:hypothetical protein
MDAERSSGTMSALNRGGDSFIGGVCSQQRARPAFQSRTPNSLIQDRRSVSINVRITAVRKLAVEAADNGLLAPELANGITRVKGVASKGVRREQVAIQRAVQLDLPQVGGKDIPVLDIVELLRRQLIEHAAILETLHTTSVDEAAVDLTSMGDAPGAGDLP